MDEFWRRPLGIAAARGRAKVVDLLLPVGNADPNLPSGMYHRTPSSWAAVEGHSEDVVSLLLAHESIHLSLNHPDFFGRTALGWAKKMGHDVKIADMIRAHPRCNGELWQATKASLPTNS